MQAGILGNPDVPVLFYRVTSRVRFTVADSRLETGSRAINDKMDLWPGPSAIQVPICG